MDAPRRCNCLLWAYARRIRRGGKVRHRRSHHVAWLPHASWSRNGVRWWSYSPLHPRHDKTALFHGPWFEGEIVLDSDVAPWHSSPAN